MGILLFIVLVNLRSKNLFFFILVAIFHGLLQFINDKFTYPGLTIWMFYIFYFAFKKSFRNITSCQVDKLIIFHSKIIIWSQAILIVCNKVFQLAFTSFITDLIKVYNYEQYYSISVVIALAVLLEISNFKWFKIFYVVVAGVGALHSSNNTALCILLLLIFKEILIKFYHTKIINIDSIKITFVVMPILVPIVVITGAELKFFEESELGLILNGRGQIWVNYFESFSIENFLFPFYDKVINSPSPHNLFLNYTHSINPVLGILLYIYLFMQIARVPNKFMSFNLLLVISIAGINLEIISHPYIAIQLAFLIAILQKRFNN